MNKDVRLRIFNGLIYPHRNVVLKTIISLSYHDNRRVVSICIPREYETTTTPSFKKLINSPDASTKVI
jgi:hypothetical protein